jgi:hypothetical protein
VKFLLDHDVPDDAAFSLVVLGHVVVILREVPRLAGERGRYE